MTVERINPLRGVQRDRRTCDGDALPTLWLAVRELGRTRRFRLFVSVLCPCVELRMCAHVSFRDVVMLQASCLDLQGFVSELHLLVVVSLVSLASSVEQTDAHNHAPGPNGQFFYIFVGPWATSFTSMCHLGILGHQDGK